MLARLAAKPHPRQPGDNFERAARRQRVVLARMVSFNSSRPPEADVARAESPHPSSQDPHLHAEFVAEMVASRFYAQLGEAAYTQRPAGHHDAGRQGASGGLQRAAPSLLDFERRKPTAARGLHHAAR